MHHIYNGSEKKEIRDFNTQKAAGLSNARSAKKNTHENREWNAIRRLQETSIYVGRVILSLLGSWAARKGTIRAPRWAREKERRPFICAFPRLHGELLQVVILLFNRSGSSSIVGFSLFQSRAAAARLWGYTMTAPASCNYGRGRVFFIW